MMSKATAWTIFLSLSALACVTHVAAWPPKIQDISSQDIEDTSDVWKRGLLTEEEYIKPCTPGHGDCLPFEEFCKFRKADFCGYEKECTLKKVRTGCLEHEYLYGFVPPVGYFPERTKRCVKYNYEIKRRCKKVGVCAKYACSRVGIAKKEDKHANLEG